MVTRASDARVNGFVERRPGAPVIPRRIVSSRSSLMPTPAFGFLREDSSHSTAESGGTRRARLTHYFCEHVPDGDLGRVPSPRRDSVDPQAPSSPFGARSGSRLTSRDPPSDGARPAAAGAAGRARILAGLRRQAVAGAPEAQRNGIAAAVLAALNPARSKRLARRWRSSGPGPGRDGKVLVLFKGRRPDVDWLGRNHRRSPVPGDAARAKSPAFPGARTRPIASNPSIDSLEMRIEEFSDLVRTPCTAAASRRSRRGCSGSPPRRRPGTA